jgi:GT2 family glycosyltransferase
MSTPIVSSPPPASATAVLVLGMHRSGTSALTRTISLLGADLPRKLIPASNTSNPTGHWEPRDVQELNDRILDAMGSRWDDWRRLDPDSLRGERLTHAQGQALDILNREYGGSRLFVLKDPRICRLLPFWLPVLERFGASPACVLLWRPPEAVAASVLRRNGVDPAKSRLLWLRHVLDAEHGSRGLRRTIVSYDELLADWRAVAHRLGAELGVAWSGFAGAQHEIDAFLHRPPDAGARPAEEDGSDGASQAARLLSGVRTAEALAAAAPELDRLRRALDDAEAAFGPALSAEQAARTRVEADVRTLNATLDVRNRYIRALENAARIRDAQLADGGVRLAWADARIGEIEDVLHRSRPVDGERERARVLQTQLFRQRRELVRQRCAELTRELPPRIVLGRTLTLGQRRDLRDRAYALLDAALLDPLWYLQASPDVLLAGVDPIWHWLLIGWREHRTPNPLFDTSWYLAAHPEAAASGADPLTYYLRHGIAQNHEPGPLFSREWYLRRNTDVRAAGMDPVVHWLKHGAAEGRKPGPWFDPGWYLEENPDVADAGLPALEHYLLAGAFDGRDPCPGFSSHWYRARYADVSGNPLLHFLKHGLAERRLPLPPRSAYRPGQTEDGIFDPRSSFVIQLELSDELEAWARALTGTGGTGRFSVILPTWNRRETLPAAINSVVGQSYPDWELIVCDDGSADGTEALVRDHYAEAINAGRIRYLHLPHGGVAAARNAGLRVAQGKWIAYLDSDNTWHPHYLLMMAAAYIRHPERRSAYACLRVHDEVQQRRFVRYNPFDGGKLLAHNYIDLNVFTHERGVYEQLGAFDESLRRLVDWDLILRYTRLYEPVLVPHVLCDYRISPALGNISLTEPLDDNEARVRRKHARFVAAAGSTPLRLACVVPAWPPSATTLADLEELCRLAVDVRVYHVAEAARPAGELPGIPAARVVGAEALGRELVADQRNWVHGADLDPGTIGLISAAAAQAGLAFSFAASATPAWTSLAKAANSDLCAAVLVAGERLESSPEPGGLAGKLLVHPPSGAMQALLDCCARAPLDIFMITHLREGDDDAVAAAERTIRCVLERTATPMVLTIVADGSASACLQRLAALARAEPRIRLVPLAAPAGFARAANTALSLARSEYVIHVSSAGSYVARAGWEQHCLHAMREVPELALAGPLIASATLTDGRSFLRQPWFPLCREPAFARRHLDRRFRQIHGGLFVLRRSVFVHEGGFNEAVPEPRCQAEYCYYLASRGHRIGHIGGLHVLADGVAPELDARLDESILALDRASPAAISLLDRCASADCARCNVCGWTGDVARHADGIGFDCPQCRSSPRDRAVLRWLAESGRALLRPTVDARGLGAAVRARLETVFPLRDWPAQIAVPTPLPIAHSHALGLPPSIAAGETEPICAVVD